MAGVIGQYAEHVRRFDDNFSAPPEHGPRLISDRRLIEQGPLPLDGPNFFVSFRGTPPAVGGPLPSDIAVFDAFVLLGIERSDVDTANRLYTFRQPLFHGTPRTPRMYAVSMVVQSAADTPPDASGRPQYARNGHAAWLAWYSLYSRATALAAKPNTVEPLRLRLYTRDYVFEGALVNTQTVHTTQAPSSAGVSTLFAVTDIISAVPVPNDTRAFNTIRTEVVLPRSAVVDASAVTRGAAAIAMRAAGRTVEV